MRGPEGTEGEFVTSASATAIRAAVISFCLSICVCDTSSAAPLVRAEDRMPQDGFAPAIITESEPETGARAQADRAPAQSEVDGQVRPHWCNATSTLIDDIHRLGGYSVMRADIGEGRTLERYWNASEEVIIEHGGDGTSCLVDLRPR